MRGAFRFHSHAVWPPLGSVLIFAMAFGALNAGLGFLQGIMMTPVFHLADVVKTQGAFLGFFAGCYALFRLLRFHPACNRGYAAWLKLSPWTAGKPLPLGPVHPVWQDIVVVGGIAALAYWPGHLNPMTPVFVYGLIYLGGMSVLLVLTRTWTSCVILAFLWPTLLLPGIEGLPMFGVVAAIVGVVWHGYRKSMRAFPWQPMLVFNPSGGPHGNPILQIEVATGNGRSTARSLSAIGWPWLALSPKFDRVSISTSNSFLCSVLAAWWAYCAMLAAGDESVSVPIFVFSLFAAGVRLMVYLSGLGPAFSLRGRGARGRFIVPGFDKVFVTPLAVVVLAFAGEALADRSGAWRPEVAAGVIVLTGFVLLAGGPTLRTWVLTGQHRYTRPPAAGGNKERLAPR